MHETWCISIVEFFHIAFDDHVSFNSNKYTLTNVRTLSKRISKKKKKKKWNSPSRGYF